MLGDGLLPQEVKMGGMMVLTAAALLHLVLLALSWCTGPTKLQPLSDEDTYPQSTARGRGGGTETLEKGKGKRKASSSASAPAPESLPKPTTDGTDKEDDVQVVVTGGSGMLGHAVIARLAEVGGYQIIAVDGTPPTRERRVPDVTYVTADLATATEPRLITIFYGAVAVVHAADAVHAQHDSRSCAVLHNTHVVATRKVVRHARLAGCKAFVLTSSTAAITNPFDGDAIIQSNHGMPTKEFQFATDYGWQGARF
jgi:hypothetical protein